MRADVTDRVAFVTGGSRGIGAAIATRLANEGAAVAIGYRSGADAADAVAHGISAAGGRCITVQGDIAVESEVDKAFMRIEQELGPVALLVNNAAAHSGGRTQGVTLDQWRTVVDSGMTGAFLCIRRALPAMIEARFGRVVNVSSVVGMAGYPGDAAYASTKAGLIGLARAVALEHARRGITANVVAPGFVATDMIEALGEDFRGGITKTIPAARLGTADEIADAVVFLLSNAYVTGALLVVDGGWCLGTSPSRS